MTGRGPLVIGHRGARGLWPENTLAGMERALDLGADVIEIDVQVTADGVPVVVHDTILTGALYRREGAWLPEPGLPVHKATWSQLRKLEAGQARPGGPVAEAFPEQSPVASAGVPRLSEVLEAMGARRAAVLLEIKRDVTDPEVLPVETVADAILSEVERTAGAPHDIVYQSFDWSVLAQVQFRLPAARISGLSSERGTPRNVFDGSPWLGRWAADVSRLGVVPVISANGWSGWSAAHQDLEPSVIERAHMAGLKVYAWTVNDTDTARNLARMGVDGIITDYPDRVS